MVGFSRQYILNTYFDTAYGSQKNLPNEEIEHALIHGYMAYSMCMVSSELSRWRETGVHRLEAWKGAPIEVRVLGAQTPD